jgi:hypothetical protein
MRVRLGVGGGDPDLEPVAGVLVAEATSVTVLSRKLSHARRMTRSELSWSA